MKKGPAWSSSREKRAFDVSLASALTPGRRAAEIIVGHLVRSTGLPSEVVFEQKRIGRLHEPFTIQKFLTISPETGKTLGFWAEKMRKLGLDEVAQLVNVREGAMSIIGYRPLIPEEFEEVRSNLPPKLGEAWARTTYSCRPGILSSYGIDHHIQPEPDANEYERRAEQDVKDGLETSLTYDLRLIATFASAALTRQLR